MFTKKVTIAVCATAALFSFAQTGYTQGMSEKGAVRDTNGDVVRSIVSDNCVRTNWREGFDECGRPINQGAVTRLLDDERSVYFEFDKAELRTNAKAKLKAIANTLINARDVKALEISGYADRIGDSSYNRDLSERRARAVQAYLNSEGYKNTRLTEVRALGDTYSQTNCASDLARKEVISCLSEDRRVDIALEYTDKTHASNNR